MTNNCIISHQLIRGQACSRKGARPTHSLPGHRSVLYTPTLQEGVERRAPRVASYCPKNVHYPKFRTQGGRNHSSVGTKFDFPTFFSHGEILALTSCWLALFKVVAQKSTLWPPPRQQLFCVSTRYFRFFTPCFWSQNTLKTPKNFARLRPFGARNLLLE